MVASRLELELVAAGRVEQEERGRKPVDPNHSPLTLRDWLGLAAPKMRDLCQGAAEWWTSALDLRGLVEEHSAGTLADHGGVAGGTSGPAVRADGTEGSDPVASHPGFKRT